MSKRRRRSRSHPDSIDFARNQRRSANEFSETVWRLVRGRQICGQKFRREHPFEPYIADFVCLSLKLIIEVDGSDHLTVQGRARDARRDRYFRDLGYETLRIRGFEVTHDVDAVRERIVATVKERLSSD